MLKLIRFKRKIYIFGAILTFVLIITMVVAISFNKHETKEASLTGMPKRNFIQFSLDETKNLISKTFFGKPTEASLKREESKKATLRKFGVFIEMSKEGKKIKNELISNPVSKRGGDYLLHASDNDLYIEYLNSADVFLATITAEPVEKYQKETEAWFLSKGFSSDDLCGLGLKFVINKDLKLKVGYPINEYFSHCS